MTNINAAKLTHVQVQQIRALASAGFTHRSIAPSFGVCVREVANIVHGRNWQWLPTEQVPLPIFEPTEAERLVLRQCKSRTADERVVLEEYRARLAAHIDDQAEREAFALRLAWRIKQPARRRGIRLTRELQA